jgi:hypothetical protein
MRALTPCADPVALGFGTRLALSRVHPYPTTITMKSTLASCLLLAAFGSAASAATAWQFGGSGAIGYNSIYEFRGVDLGSNMVEATATATATYGDLVFGASAWYAAVNDNAINPTPNELDPTLSVSKAFGPVTVTGGYIYYAFNDASAADAQELYLGASMEIYAGVAANLTAYREIDLYDGWYVDFNLSKTCELSSCLSVVTTAGCGFADGHGWQLESDGTTLDGFQHWYLAVSLPWEFREGFTLAPYMKYVAADSDLVSDVPGAGTGDEHLVYGVKLNFSF